MRTLTTFGVMLGLGLGSAACSDDPTGSGDTTGTPTTTATTPDVTDDDSDSTTTTTDEDTTVVPDSVEPTEVTQDTSPEVEVIPDPGIVPDNTLCSAFDGKMENIYDVQNPDCPDHPNVEPIGSPGVYLELEGVIVTGAFGDTWFIQDPRGGPYSGVQVFNHGLMSNEVVVGDVLTLTGNYYEFFESTQIYLTEAEVTGTAALPQPFLAEYPEYLATNGALAEMFEGVLVRVEDVRTTHTRPDCPYEYGEFEVSGGVRVDDLACRSGSPEAACTNGFRWKAHLGDTFASITGPLHYTFGNHKIEPRDAADLVVTNTGAVTGISKCIASECQADASLPGTKAIVINEVMADPYTQDTNQEWIELYNPGNASINVNGWQIRDCGDQAFTLNGPNLDIPAKGYLVVGASTNSALNGGVPVDLAYGQGFYLPNTVGSVLLYDGPADGSALVDQMRYEQFDPWDFASGRSLERVSPTSNGTLSTSWVAGQEEFGTLGNHGTPGERNDAN